MGAEADTGFVEAGSGLWKNGIIISALRDQKRGQSQVGYRVLRRGFQCCTHLNFGIFRLFQSQIGGGKNESERRSVRASDLCRQDFSQVDETTFRSQLSRQSAEPLCPSRIKCRCPVPGLFRCWVVTRLLNISKCL